MGLKKFWSLFVCLILFPSALFAAPAVTVTPLSLTFGNQALNVKSKGQNVLLTNNQTVPLLITQLSINLADYTDVSTCPLSPVTLGAGASCTITVYFTPTVTGLRTGSLSIIDTANVNPMVSLTGTGIIPVTVSPSTLTFGSQVVGNSGAPQIATLTNNQSTALTISSVTANLSDFTLTTTCPFSPATLAAGASCSATVTFKPQVTGNRSGTLSFADNVTGSPQRVSLRGTGSTSALTAITISPLSASIGIGATKQFMATGRYTDGSTQSLTNSVTWSTSVPAVATIAAGGLATSVSQGSTSVIAASGTISGSGTLTVTAPTLTSIAITPASPSIEVGSTEQFTATGTYSDKSTQDVTGTASWTSTSPSIASIVSAGLAKGIAPGTATIKATVNSVVGSTPLTVTQTAVAYYVAPNGNDSNPGTLLAPLLTVQKAEALVVANYLGTHCASRTSPIIVQFRAGRWDNLALNLTNTNSGCSSAAPVVYEAYPGETPIFSAGVRVQNWVNTSGSTWQATLPSNTINFEALYYNGVRRLRARLGATSATGTVGPTYRVAANVSGQFDRFYYAATDPISTTWENYAPSVGNPCGQAAGPANLQGDIQIGIFEKWDLSWERISCIDTTNHLIYLTGSVSPGEGHGYIVGHRYVVENVKDALTVPGQWFLDKSVTGAWVLTYLANAGEDPNTATVMIPQQSQILFGTGVQYRRFSGITFSFDNYVVGPKGYAGSQADIMVLAAVQCLDCSYITFDSDSFTNIEGYGLGFPTDNKGTATGNLIEDSAFWDIGGGGISTGRVPNGGETDANVFQFATIQNNLVQGYGRKFPGSAGIVNLLSHDVTTTHNDVNDGYNQGIMICFPNFSLGCAGNAGSNGGFNQAVTYNHIWNLGQGILDDFGGVYLATYNAAGNVIDNNKIHDISDASPQDSDGYGGNGFYIDRGGPIEIKNNLIYRTINAFNMTMGPPSVGQIINVENNIFAFARTSVIKDWTCAQPGYTQFAINNNIILQDRTSASSTLTAIQFGPTFLGTPVGSAQEYSSNDYWNLIETFSSDAKAFNAQSSGCGTKTYYTLAGWEALGEDHGSTSVNPGFTAPTYPSDDYSFSSGPPNIGFVPFDTTGTCPTCPGRTAPVINPGTVAAGFPTKLFNPATDF